MFRVILLLSSVSTSFLIVLSFLLFYCHSSKNNINSNPSIYSHPIFTFRSPTLLRKGESIASYVVWVLFHLARSCHSFLFNHRFLASLWKLLSSEEVVSNDFEPAQMYHLSQETLLQRRVPSPYSCWLERSSFSPAQTSSPQSSRNCCWP